MSYIHLTPRDRMALYYLHQQGHSLRSIGRQLGRSHTTLSRELKRNGRPMGWCYCDRYAQRQAEARKKIARHHKLGVCLLLTQYVDDHLAKGWSPEIISGRLKRDYPRDRRMRISHESIYARLYRDASRGCQKYRYLVRAHKKRRKQYKYSGCRGLIRNRVDISERPQSADARSRFGHWEGDTMVGCGHKGRIVTHVERKSRYLIAKLAKDGTAKLFNKASIEAYQKIPEQYCKTITLDNGSENSEHEALSKALNATIYFAKPYASWERGTNENTNGLIRRYFPKKTNFLNIEEKQLEEVVELLNHRPRKCLNYQTAFEVFYKATSGALIT